MKEKVILFGATSDLAVECAKVFARNQCDLILVSRGVDRLKPLQQDLSLKFKSGVELVEMDANNWLAEQPKIKELSENTSIAICFLGILGEQSKAEENQEHLIEIVNINYLAAVGILSEVASCYEKKKKGVIIGVSSVAGERGRMSNYFYGSAKAGFTAFLSGLRNRLYHSGVHVLTVKPGFMYTKMTEHLDLPKLLTVHPDKAANSIYRACKSRKNTIYISEKWRLIMWIIKCIPEGIFKRLKL